MKAPSVTERFAAPIIQQRRNQLAQMSAQVSGQMNNPFLDLAQQQYNALASNGGPTRAAAAQVSGATAQQVRQGLIDRGMPAHIAEAFVVNMKDESGLKPGINEHEPLVPGSRGGYGLYQLTGPRRRQYEAFAQQRGAPLDSVDAQLDFLMRELETTERRAGQKIMGANSTADAAVAIVNDFLRPAATHRKKRAARYSRM